MFFVKKKKSVVIQVSNYGHQYLDIHVSLYLDTYI